MINLYHGDCMEAMKLMKDKQYDLAIVDPPYGINEGNKFRGMGSSCMATDYGKKDWDKERPKAEYFQELLRVSKEQIIWGGNYFVQYLKPSMGWIFWDKEASGDFSDGELAYTSFEQALKKYVFAWMGMRQGNMKNKEERIHPTQKPVALYKWLLTKYAKQGDKILDTHGGSMSIAIACHDLDFDLDLWELDKDYYEAGVKRFEKHKQQLKLSL